MSTFVFVTWNGGGNVTPALGIARSLAGRGHTVAFLGEETQRRRIEAAGLAFTAYTRRPDWDGTPPQTPAERQRRLMRNIWMNDSLADDLTTLREFDGVADDPEPHVRYVGPVFEKQPTPPDWRLPWDHDDPRPLVLASFSTMPGQTEPSTLQRVFDALEGLPLRLLLATGPFSPETLAIPPNAAIFGYVPHAAVLPHAALAINHAGHGSVMAALAHGVPLVCLPTLGADQGIIAGRVQALGVGKAIPGQAGANELRSAVEQVMATPAYRVAARRLARLIGREDGAANGASILEACVP